jgi:hypothetical protein
MFWNAARSSGFKSITVTRWVSVAPKLLKDRALAVLSGLLLRVVGVPTIRGGSPIGDILRIGLGFIVLGGIDRADSAVRVEHAGHVRSKMNRAILDIGETGW